MCDAPGVGRIIAECVAGRRARGLLKILNDPHQIVALGLDLLAHGLEDHEVRRHLLAELRVLHLNADLGAVPQPRPVDLGFPLYIICIYIYIYREREMYIYIYIYIREREKEKETWASEAEAMGSTSIEESALISSRSPCGQSPRCIASLSTSATAVTGW